VVDDLPDVNVLPAQTQPKEADLQELVRQEVAGVELVSVAGPKRPETPLTVYKLTEEEIQQLKEQLLKEQQRDAVVQLLDMLSVMLEIEQDEVSFGEILEIMGKLVDLFIDQGDLVHAASCVQGVYRLRQTAGGGLQARLEQFLRQLGTPERFGALTTMLNRQKLIDTDLLTRYLMVMTEPAMVPMTELLGTLNSLQARKTVCDVLAQLAEKKIEVIASRLRDERWYIVRNLIYVMGRIGGPKAADYLAPLVRHTEPRVRKELVKTLDAMDAPKAIDLLLEMLRDQEGVVRMAALRALARRKSAQVVAPLAAIIENRHFAGKDLSEKLEVFAALAASGQTEALTLLGRYLYRTSWWRRTEHEQLRWCAAYALKHMGTPEAIALLEQGSRGRNRNLQEACAAALRGTARELMMKQARS
jgi:HEAT repeat protein